MNHRTTLSACFALALGGASHAQLELLPQPYWASTVNNDCLVAGYLTGSPTYLVWNPDLGTTTDIGGVSPGGNAGGQAKFSADGTKLSGSDMGATASEMATYDMATDTWTTHGGIGGVSDGNTSSGWSISGDGGTVVGLGWVNSGSAHGVAYNAAEGIMDLGTINAGASTRANAVSDDGSIVVGWQDLKGPWKAAVWHKDPNGATSPIPTS